MRKTITRLFLHLPVLLLIVPACYAAERDWFKYENAYFEAYSDAREKKVRELLDDLENFRAAVLQVGNFKVPDGAPKTQVLIFSSKREYVSLTGSGDVSAFTTSLDGIPYIVMPVGGLKRWSKFSIRHEFAHVLQSYRDVDLPLWYREGFAEFMSATRFRDKGKKFTIGDETERQKSFYPWIPWGRLTSRDYDFHGVGAIEKLSDAYYQSWLLVHYLMIGDGGSNFDAMRRYLVIYARGEETPETFEEVFGSSATALGNRIVREYLNRMPYYEVDFRPEMQDHNFIRTPAPTDSTTATIEALRNKVYGAFK